MAAAIQEKRFRVALSFPGEHRPFVSRVAAHLTDQLGRGRVLYDKYYEAEFARINLDTYLQGLYRNESDLIAVFLCADYERKEWPGLEWRVIRELIKRREASTVMFVRLDSTDISGLLSIDGFVSVDEREPKEIADLILQRLHLESGPAPVPVQPGQHPAGGGIVDARIAPSRLTHSAEKLIGREAELARLEEAWNDPKQHVLTIVAFGGVGKTSLVSHWAAELAKRDYDGASYFDWSFYSQGTREQGGASADQFVARALEFFGDAELAASAASPWDKGARLAQLVAQRRALLVLDGLEPLQYPPSSPLAGVLRDPAIAALLKGLAQRNVGLCVVTTREGVSDLASFRHATAPEVDLAHLSIEAGVELLRNLRVRGTAGELEALTKEVKGHALTLNLLGRYLARAHRGDVRMRDQVHFVKADASVQGGHAFRAMEAYERWLGEGDGEGERQLAVLRLMGLFDRPADAGCLAALRRPPAVAGLTEPIVELGEDDWNFTVATLGDCGLLSVPIEITSGPVGIDAHPLIREYFATRLRDESVEAWQEGHSRIFEHLKDSVELRPATLDGLQPLYEAVGHGCHARRHAEVLEEVYRNRILRGNEFYSTRMLGAFGAELGAVACFFDHPWIKVSPLLTNAEQPWLLNEAANRLRALGRLTEALQPMRTGLKKRVEQDDWKNAAMSGSNLCDLELTLGEIDLAVADADQSVDHADRSGDPFWRMGSRTTLAGALHQAHRHDEALALFREAESMQAGYQPYPLLYSVRGFRYCDLLLSQPERAAWKCMIPSRPDAPPRTCGIADVTAFQDAANRATEALVVSERNRWLLDIALDHLTLGRVSLYQTVLRGVSGPNLNAVAESAGDWAARQHLGTAVDGLRHAGQQHYLPRGLLSRAWLRFLEEDFDGACTDLDEACEIAERGPMRLHMADIHLHRARLFHAVRPYPWESPHADLASARKLIEQCGYWRRKEELQDAEAAAKER